MGCATLGQGRHCTAWEGIAGGNRGIFPAAAMARRRIFAIELWGLERLRVGAGAEAEEIATRSESKGLTGGKKFAKQAIPPLKAGRRLSAPCT